MRTTHVNQLRGQGRVRIRKQLWYTGPTSRVDIADALSLSVPAVTVAVNDMLGAGEIYEHPFFDTQVGKLGRRARALDIAPEYCYFIGIEMRRDSRHICLSDYRGNLLEHMGEYVSFHDYEDNMDAVGRMTKEFLKRISVDYEKIRSICVTLPGVVDYERGILTEHSLYGWFNKPIAFAGKDIR